MPKRPHPALVGVFVVVGGLLILLALVFWGSGRFFTTEYKYVCYFPGSVNGLSVGAPVKYRGVTIGRVRDMLIPYSVMGRSDVRVAVVIGLQSRVVRKRGGEEDPTPEVIGALIRRGLRAQLQSESYITGTLFVSLDVVPEAPVSPPGPPRDHYPEIPTMPSQVEETRELVARLSEQLGTLDLPATMRSIGRTFDAATTLLEGPEIHRTLGSLTAASQSIQRLTAEVEREVAALHGNFDGARVGLAGIGGAVADLRATLAPNSPFIVDLRRTLGELDRAARAIRSLAELLERTPNALVAGKKQ